MEEPVTAPAAISALPQNLKQVICRILIVGNHRNRVVRVFQILNDEFNLKVTTKTNQHVQFQFMPCVARFGAFKNEKGELVRYLERIDCWVSLIEHKLQLSETPTSLLPFLDDNGDANEESPNEISFPGISGAVIGAGIDDECDVKSIQSLFQSLSPNRNIPITTVEPNPEYRSMKEELTAFKELSSTEKEFVTRDRTMGPGKTAKTAHDFALKILDDAVSLIIDKMPDAEKNETQRSEPASAQSDEVEETAETIKEYVPNLDNVHYSCRKCRTVLFGDGDLQDPPHVPSRHAFSYRKHGIGSSEANHSCQSHFLQAGLPWITDMSDTEGKFHCPKCASKVGTWNWSGAQCSCGTWVVPAIQVPKSRVDTVHPRTQRLPEGTVISPTLQHLHQVQQKPVL